MISRYLNDNNISAKSYHGGMSSKERNYVQELFTSNKIRVLWLVLHIYSRVCLPFPDLPSRLHKQANGESMENLCEAFSCSYGFSWPNEGVSGFP
ncbi:ATP-dependent DNA helicase Q-like [Arachis hypogaea]|nr:ATP-dependent DNA helicase Q-like [Arachis hypogaea]